MSLFLYWSLTGTFGISSVFARDGVSDCITIMAIWNQSFWYIGAVGSRNVFNGGGGVTLEKEGIRGLKLLNV